MNRLEQWVFSKAVGFALKHRSNNPHIPRTGPEGDAVNCFVVYVDQPEQRKKWYAVVDRIDRRTAFGTYHIDGAPPEQIAFALSSLSSESIVVMHYRGSWDFEFKGLWD
jgi:hypothetical protein